MPFFHVTRGFMSEGTSSALIKTCVLGGSVLACAYAGYKAWKYFSIDKSDHPSNSKDEWFPAPDTISVESDVDSGYLVLDPRFTTPKGVSWLDICPKEPLQIPVELEADYVMVDEEDAENGDTEYYDDEEDVEFYDPEIFADAEEDEDEDEE